MSLSRTILICFGIAAVVWLGWTLLPAAIQVGRGRATGIGVIVPRVFQWLPRPAQIPITLLGVPLVVGSLAGCLWYFAVHR